MSIKITMPALSPTMEKGNLSKWLVKEGDDVHSGDVIAEIETDKATMEVEAADEGIVAKIIVPAGSHDVKVNTVIAVLAEEGENAAQVAQSAAGVNAPAAAPPKRQTASGAAKEAEIVEQKAPSVSPLAAAPAAASALAAESPAQAGDRAQTAGESRKSEIFASPLARRLAMQAHLDISLISGSGPRGRIVQSDVIKAEQSGGAAASGFAPQGDSGAEAAILSLYKAEDYEIAPHNPMRKVIARRLVESKQTVPHFYVTVDCNIGALLKLRADFNAAAPLAAKEDGSAPAYKLSVNDMVIKAVAVALKRVPEANVSWLESGMIQHKHSDIGVAVSIPNGLITPIIRYAEEKSLPAISNEMKDLIKRAKQMKLKPEEYQGGVSTVSNLGMFGVKAFSAIVNPPQATIFAVGAGEKRAVAQDGAVIAADIMSVTLSADHRAVDGALAADLAQNFKTIIENPLSMIV